MATELTVESGMHIEPETPGGPIATPQVEGERQEEAVERPRHPREILMERIAERRKEALAREIAYGVELEERRAEDERGDEAPTERGDAGEPPLAPRRDAAGRFAAETPPPQQQAPAPQQQAQPTAQPQPQLFPLDRGDGQPIWVTPEQMMQLARDGIVARQAVDRYNAQPQQQQSAQQQPTQQQQPAPRADTIDQTKTEDYFRRLTFGDASEGGKALAELAQEAVRMARQSQPDPAALAAYATEQALARIRLENNVVTIGNEFPEVFNNNVLTRMAAEKVGALRQQNAMLRTYKPELALYRDACNAVMAEWKGPEWRQATEERQTSAPQPATQAAPTAAISPAKLERKRAAPAQPTAASRVASEDAGQPWRGDRSAVVDQIRRARGQMSMR
jgi:hypothetical protein